MSSEHESLETKKAMAFDLFNILDNMEEETEKGQYTIAEFKALIKAYIQGASGK